MKSEVYQGKIKQYDATKGYGFIGGLEQDVFFHISDFPLEDGEPKRNERVKIQRVVDQSAKAKKSRAVENNMTITSALLSNFKNK